MACLGWLLHKCPVLWLHRTSAALDNLLCCAVSKSIPDIWRVCIFELRRPSEWKIRKNIKLRILKNFKALLLQFGYDHMAAWNMETNGITETARWNRGATGTYYLLFDLLFSFLSFSFFRKRPFWVWRAKRKWLSVKEDGTCTRSDYQTLPTRAHGIVQAHQS